MDGKRKKDNGKEKMVGRYRIKIDGYLALRTSAEESAITGSSFAKFTTVRANTFVFSSEKKVKYNETTQKKGKPTMTW